jgi:hypothetical protein
MPSFEELKKNPVARRMSMLVGLGLVWLGLVVYLRSVPHASGFPSPPANTRPPTAGGGGGGGGGNNGPPQKKGPQVRTHVDVVATEMSISEQEKKDVEEIMKARQEAMRKRMRELQEAGAPRPTVPGTENDAEVVAKLKATLGAERGQEFFDKYRKRETAPAPPRGGPPPGGPRGGPGGPGGPPGAPPPPPAAPPH